jgi:hypothetical protein
METCFKYNIFISYSWANAVEVHKLCESLEKKYKIWLDKDGKMLHGNMHDTIRMGIDESKIFLCCASKNYCKQGGTALKEHKYAVDKRKPIVYVMFEKFQDEQDRLEQLKEIRFHFEGQIYHNHNHIDQILSAIDKINKKPEPGLSFLHKCNRCVTYGNENVMINMGFGSFKLGTPSDKIKCPLCSIKLSNIPIAYYFNQCNWKYEGIVKKDNNDTEYITTDWKVVGDEMYCFNDDFDWIELVFYTESY